MGADAISISAYSRLVRTNRNFRLLWSAQIVSEIGDWLYTVAIYSLLLEFTGSAKAVALAFVLQVLPQFLVSPAAGVLNDRVSRKKVMIVADWTRAVIVLSMVLVRSAGWIWFLYLLLLLETLMWAAFEPGRSAVIPNITKGSDRLVANALSSTTWAFNLAVGSAIGGLAAAFFGRDTVFVLNALTFVVSALLLSRMRFEEPHMEGQPPLRLAHLADFRPVREGLRYVRQDRRLLATMFVKCGSGLLGVNWVLLTILGERVFPVQIGGLDSRSGGMLGMSLLMGCRGIGALIGPLVATPWSRGSEERMRLGILFGYLAGAAGYVTLGITRVLPAACASVALAHAGGSVCWVFSSTILQANTVDRFRGRVFSVEYGFAMLTMSTVNSLAGTLIDFGMDVRTLAWMAGLALLVPAAAWLSVQGLWREKPVSVTSESL
jgi:MFS family permease